MIALARVAARKRQRGFSLVASVFILVVLALLGAYMVTIGGVQRTTVVQALQAARAYQAANAGIEWGIRSALATGVCTAAFALADAVLNGFQVSVTCTPSAHREGADCFSIYHITAFAQYGAVGDPYFVSRQIDAQVTGDAVSVPPGSPCP